MDEYEDDFDVYEDPISEVTAQDEKGKKVKTFQLP